jgi:ribosome-associated protein
MKTNPQLLFDTENTQPQVISKTKAKEHMQELQDLGVALVALSKDKLAKFNLPNTLIDAIALAHKITSNGATRRHYQYIGKLMRDVDYNYIKHKLAEVNNDSIASTKLLHLTEQWRDRLLAQEEELKYFLLQYPDCDIQELRTLIRSVRREVQLGQNRNYRKLFKFIRDIIEGNK